MDILELTPPETIKNLTSPRMLSTHLRPRRLPVDLIDNKCRIVLVLRNPKDVAVSAFHQLRNTVAFSNKQSWDEFLTSFMEGKLPWGGYLDYLEDWNNILCNSSKQDSCYNVQLFFYEDLKNNTLDTIRKLSECLGFVKNIDELKEVEQACSFGRLREKTNKENSGVPSTLKGINGRSVLFRKGAVGDWKNYFSVSQNAAFDQLIKDRLGHSIFFFKYE